MLSLVKNKSHMIFRNAVLREQRRRNAVGWFLFLVGVVPLLAELVYLGWTVNILKATTATTDTIYFSLFFFTLVLAGFSTVLLRNYDMEQRYEVLLLLILVSLVYVSVVVLAAGFLP